MKVPAIACACLAFTYFAGVAGACEPVRRALVVGINLYTGNRKPGVRVEKPLVARQPVDGAFHAREFGNLAMPPPVRAMSASSFTPDTARRSATPL
ncbi:exported hypothetical protein [Candidatus Sulfopaludibacter sp. SbA4]|nr:exported hypothetical protein [Candidatus Sulfopaludibacter sp. SbA4]